MGCISIVPMDPLWGHSITYRIAVGQQAGRKVFTLQTLPAEDPGETFANTVSKVAGFSLHAGVATKAHERKTLERLCRYISRPAVSEKRLSLVASGKVCYELKTPYCDGTTHVSFEPLDFLTRLAALEPKPRVNLTRYHGVFAPNSKLRALVTPTRRGKGHKPGLGRTRKKKRKGQPSAGHRRPGHNDSNGLSVSTSRPAGNAATPSRSLPA
jgi:hypothetical protein